MGLHIPSYRYYLSLPGGLVVCIKVPCPAFNDVLAQLLLSNHIPGARFIYSDVGDLDLTISFEDAATPRLFKEKGLISVSDRWSGNGSILDIVHLTYSAVRLFWLQQGLYTVHSACVGNQGGYGLLVGHSGVGKTSIALALARKQQGLKLFSANKTLVRFHNSMTWLDAVAGTRTITTRSADASRQGTTTDAPIGYQDRSATHIDNDCYAAQERVPIRFIALVRLNDGASDCSRIEPLSALHRLQPYFMDRVNADTVLCGGREVYAGGEPSWCSQSLALNLSRILTGVPTFSITGSMEFVTASLEALYA